MQQAPAEPAPVVRRCDADLVHPQLRRFIGMHIMERRGHADHHASVERDGQVVARVGEKFGRPAWVDGVVEYLRRDVVEHRGVAGAEQADGVAHELLSL